MQGGMNIYNTLTRRIEEIVPLEDGKIKIYSCGPTVYRYIHIGNLRTFTMADCLRRAFEYRGLQVLHVKNITDVGHMRQELLDRGEDKIVAEALSAGLPAAEIARRFTDEFFRDEQCINILPADVFPRATDHVERMIEIVSALVDGGHAYVCGGNAYFRVASFAGYG